MLPPALDSLSPLPAALTPAWKGVRQKRGKCLGKAPPGTAKGLPPSRAPQKLPPAAPSPRLGEGSRRSPVSPRLALSCDLETLPLLSKSRAVKACQMGFRSSSFRLPMARRCALFLCLPAPGTKRASPPRELVRRWSRDLPTPGGLQQPPADGHSRKRAAYAPRGLRKRRAAVLPSRLRPGALLSSLGEDPSGEDGRLPPRPGSDFICDDGRD